MHSYQYLTITHHPPATRPDCSSGCSDPRPCNDSSVWEKDEGRRGALPTGRIGFHPCSGWISGRSPWHRHQRDQEDCSCSSQAHWRRRGSDSCPPLHPLCHPDPAGTGGPPGEQDPRIPASCHLRGPLKPKNSICTISLYRHRGIMLAYQFNASLLNKPCFNNDKIKTYKSSKIFLTHIA